jgi:hypothetical protein
MLKYDEFIDKVNEAGFWTPFTNYIDQQIFTFHYPPEKEPRVGQSYTGDPDTDPEIWKIRAVKEKKLAYGNFFNGKPGGYIAPRFYSIFVDAFKPRMTFEERYKAGKIGQHELKIWNLLSETKKPMTISQFYSHYKMRAKENGKYLESALKCLQMTFDIAMCGNVVVPLKNGTIQEHYGYDKAENWIPAEWMKMNPRMEHEEALEIIYRQAEKISNTNEAKKAFNKSLKLYKM